MSGRSAVSVQTWMPMHVHEHNAAMHHKLQGMLAMALGVRDAWSRHDSTQKAGF